MKNKIESVSTDKTQNDHQKQAQFTSLHSRSFCTYTLGQRGTQTKYTLFDGDLRKIRCCFFWRGRPSSSLSTNGFLPTASGRLSRFSYS